jgi:hypothetical protein
MFEDRPVLTGAKLSLLSLARHNPELKVVAFFPGASDEFLRWASRLSNVEVRSSRGSVFGNGWNVKPTAILTMLDEGHDQVLWLDTDIIVCGDLMARLDPIPPECIVGTEEYFWGHRQGSPLRTSGLGLAPSRVLPATVNTGLLRASKIHRPLVEHWASIVSGPEYFAAQELSPTRRPIHLFDEQEVLTGLLGSSQYADIDVVQLKRGVDIAQCFGPSGFTLKERLQAHGKIPLLVHTQGPKPWSKSEPKERRSFSGRLMGYYQTAHLDVTPYVFVAMEYRDQMDEDVSWMSPATALGRGLSRLYKNQPLLREAPLTVIDSAQRKFRRVFHIGIVGSKADTSKLILRTDINSARTLGDSSR